MGEVFASARGKGTTKGPIGRATGTEAREGVLMVAGQLGDVGAGLGFLVGAGEGNRTLMTSLEGRG
jgi:hypothetical protein